MGHMVDKMVITGNGTIKGGLSDEWSTSVWYFLERKYGVFCAFGLVFRVKERFKLILFIHSIFPNSKGSDIQDYITGWRGNQRVVIVGARF